MSAPCILNPCEILQAIPHTVESRRSPKRRTLLILNRPLEGLGWDRFLTLWRSCDYRVCADGGANRLLNLVQTNEDRDDNQVNWEEYLPNAIVGDLDSIHPPTQKVYSSTKKVQIVHDPDQYSTDFGKSIKHILENSSTRDIIILGSLGGRVDQCLGLYHEFYREHLRLQQDPTTVDTANGATVRLWLIQDSTLSFLLLPGRSLIKNIGPESGFFTEMVGILPLFGAASISIEGFEWDVRDWKTEMGGNVSTSNHIRARDVVVETDHVVLFTVELTGGKEMER